jgi:hypothetical protein
MIFNDAWYRQFTTELVNSGQLIKGSELFDHCEYVMPKVSNGNDSSIVGRMWAKAKIKTLDVHRLHYEDALQLWATSKAYPRDELVDGLGLFPAILKQKLRMVWEAAQTDRKRAKSRMNRLMVETLHFAIENNHQSHQMWFVRLTQMLLWLQDHVGSLAYCRTCGNHYIKVESNDGYCSPPCADAARLKQADSKRKGVFTDTHRQAISESMKSTWKARKQRG